MTCYLKDRRCICDVSGKTFTQHRVRSFINLSMVGGVGDRLMAYGCPVQACAKAFLLDERTVRGKTNRCTLLTGHEHVVLVIYVPIRVWIGEVVNLKGDPELTQSLTDKVRQIALRRPLLPAVEGF